MNAQPLLFLGDRRRDALTTRCAAAARRWRQSWAPRADDSFEASCEATVTGSVAAVASVATSAWQFEVAGECVAVLLLPHGTFTWSVHEPGGQPLDGGASVAEDSLAEELEQEVARTLMLETCGIERREIATVSRAPLGDLAEWARNARAWKLAVKSGTGRSFTLLVSAARIETLAPARAVAVATALQSRHDAVGENTVGLRVIVGETSVPVGELAGLAVDDVLVLDQLLTEPVSIVCGVSGASIGAGNLGRSGAKRAIKITGATAPRTQARGNS